MPKQTKLPNSAHVIVSRHFRRRARDAAIRRNALTRGSTPRTHFTAVKAARGPFRWYVVRPEFHGIDR